MRSCFVGCSVEVPHDWVGAFNALAVELDQIAFSIPAFGGDGQVNELSPDHAVSNNPQGRGMCSSWLRSAC